MHAIYWIKEVGIIVAFLPTVDVGVGQSGEHASKHWHALTAADEDGLDKTIIGLRIASDDENLSPLVGLLPPALASADAVRVTVSSFSGFAICNASIDEVLLSENVRQLVEDKHEGTLSKICLQSDRLTKLARFHVGKDANEGESDLIGSSSFQKRSDAPRTVCGPFRLQISAVDPSEVSLRGAVSPGRVKFIGVMDARQAARLRLIVIPRRFLSAGGDPLELNLSRFDHVNFKPDPALEPGADELTERWLASAPAHPRDYVILTSIAQELSFEAKEENVNDVFDLLSQEENLDLKPARAVFEVGLNALLKGQGAVDEDGRTITANFAVAINTDDNAFRAVHGLAVSDAFETYLARELTKCADVYLSRSEIGRLGCAIADGIGWSNENYAKLAPLLAATEYLNEDVAQRLADNPIRPDFCFLMDQNLPITFDDDLLNSIRDWKPKFSHVLYAGLGPSFITDSYKLCETDALYLAISALAIEGFQPLVRFWNLSPKSAVELARAWSEHTPEKFVDLSEALTRFSGLFPRFPEGDNEIIRLVRWYERPANIIKAAPELAETFSKGTLNLTVQTADCLIDASSKLVELQKEVSDCSNLGKVRTILNFGLRREYWRLGKLPLDLDWPDRMEQLGKKLEAAAKSIKSYPPKPSSDEAQPKETAVNGQ